MLHFLPFIYLVQKNENEKESIKFVYRHNYLEQIPWYLVIRIDPWLLSGKRISNLCEGQYGIAYQLVCQGL